MTFREFATAAFLLPSNVFSGLTNGLLGSYKRNARTGAIKTATNEDGTTTALTNSGLLGNVLDGIKYVGRAVSNFVYNHKQAIATAFWASLALAGAAALTVFLWPAALTAVTTFTIAGLSIAGVVGANVVAQIGAVAALTAAATSVAVYATAAVVNTISAISSFFASRSRPQGPSANQPTFTGEEDGNKSARTMSNLGGKVPTAFTQAQDQAPLHTTVLRPAQDTTPVVDQALDNTTPVAQMN